MGSERAWAVLSSTIAVAAGAFSAGPAAGVTAGTAWALLGWVTLAPPTSRRPGAALLCLVGLGVGRALPEALLADPLSPLSVQAPGQRWLLGVRLLLLACALWAYQDQAEPRRTRILALVGASFLASLALQAAALAQLALVLVLLGRQPWPPLPLRALPARGLLAALALLTAASATWPRVQPAGSPPGAEAATETRRALGQGNLFHAQFWAMRWAGGERGHPGEGHATLADVELRLGHLARAEQVRADLARGRPHESPQAAPP